MLTETYLYFVVNLKVQNQKRRAPANVDPQRVSQCNGMVRDILQLYSSQMSHMLVDNLVPGRPRPGENANEGAPEEGSDETPRTESAVVTAFFLGKIITEVSNCVNDVNGLSLRDGAFMILVDMMQRVRWRFVEVVCYNWGEGNTTRSSQIVAEYSDRFDVLTFRSPRLHCRCQSVLQT